MKKTLIALIAFLVPSVSFAAVPVTQVVNGGTGSTTLSGIMIGNGTASVRTLTIGSGLSLVGTTLSTTGGSSASSTLLSDFNTWSGNNIFAGASTTIVRFSSFLSTTTNSTTTTASFTNASTTNLVVSSIPSALLVTNSSGSASSYAGTSCTNQFVRSVSATGVATCATVSSSDVSLANLTAGDTSLTFSGTYNGSTARTIVLNVGNANTWTALQNFNSQAASIGSSTPFGSFGIQTTAGVWPFTIGSSTGTWFGINDYGGIQVNASQPATSTTITFDWSKTGPQTEYRIGISATTITIINATTSQYWGSTKRVWVCNPGTTAGALTWAGVEWIGTAPTQTTTANQCDLYSFDVTRATSTSAYKVAGAAATAFQ